MRLSNQLSALPSACGALPDVSLRTLLDSFRFCGIILEAAKFPGWDSVGALAAHLRFVREHHKRVRKIAVVTDSAMGNVGEKLGSHFVAAEIKHFPAGQAEAARQWVLK